MFKRALASCSIQTKIVMVLLFFSLLPLTVVGYFAYLTASEALQLHLQEKLVSLSVNNLDKIDRIFLERQSDVQIWARSDLAQVAVEIGSGIGGASKFVNDLILRYRVYELILLLQANGTCVTVNTVNHRHEALPTEELFLGQNFAHEPWFYEALRQPVTITDWQPLGLLQALYRTQQRPLAAAASMMFAAPIIDQDDGRVLGVLINVIAWPFIEEILAQTQAAMPDASTNVINLLLLADCDTIIASAGLTASDGQPLDGRRISVDLQQPELPRRLAGAAAKAFSYDWNGTPKTVILSSEQGFESYAGHHWRYLLISDDTATNARVRAFRSQTILFGLFMTGVIVLFAYLISQQAAAPLRHLSETAAAIARGDLTRPALQDAAVELTGVRDEFQISLASFGQMAENLQHLLSHIKNASAQVNDASLSISAALHQFSHLAEQQAAAIVETTATVSKFLTTSREIAQSAHLVADFAETTEQESHKGVQAAVATLARIQEIKSANDHNVTQFFALSSHSKEIHQIVATITEIADTTELIAFNAALEAAGAGDKGKRFGVVASEIRRLATTVNASAKNINLKTAAIQHVIQALVRASEEETQRVENGVRDMHVTATALEAILGKIEKTTTSLMHISAATQQQQVSHEQLVNALQQMSQETLQFQEIAQQTLHITMQLQHVAQNLQQAVNRFQVTESESHAAAFDETFAEPRANASNRLI